MSMTSDFVSILKAVKENIDHDSMEETPERISRIHEHMETTGLLRKLTSISALPAAPEVVSRVHTTSHVERLQDLALDYSDILNVRDNQPVPRRPGLKHTLGRDTYDNEHTSACIFLSCGSLLEATKSVLSGSVKSAFANIRPPGHHAAANKVDGFCFVNNVAVAAQFAIDAFGLRKVMIVDWDVHHGNGTQEIFSLRDDVLFVSLHRYEKGTFYPVCDKQHTPAARGDFQGEGPGLGFSYNLAWDSLDPSHSAVTDGDYKQAFDSLILPMAAQFSPEVIFVSCGFDAMAEDPLGGMQLTPWVYAYMTEGLMQIGSGRLVVALEGGYHLDNLAAGSEAVIRALLGEEFQSSLYPN